MTCLHFQRRLALLAVLSATSGACQLAQAEAHSKVSLSNYQYTLTDLDPTDGIDASVTWSPGVLTQNLSASTSGGVGYGGGPNTTGTGGSSKSYEVPLGTAQSFAYEGFAVSSDAQGMTASVDITVGGGQWGAVVRYDQAFVLGANTAITFVAMADMTSSVVVPPGSVVIGPYGYLDNGYFDWAPIQASTTALITVGDTPFTGLGSSPPCWGDACSSMAYLTDFMRSYDTGEQVKDQVLSVTLSNGSAASLSKTLSAVAYISGYATAPLAMVPESSTWAMMGAGMAGIGLCVRRRRRADTPA